MRKYFKILILVFFSTNSIGQIANEVDCSVTFEYKKGQFYYRDFIYPYLLDDANSTGNHIDNYSIKVNSNKKSKFTYSGDSALYYFHKVWNSCIESRPLIYYPIKQLECYLNLPDSIRLLINYVPDFKVGCLPFDYFTNIPQNWECKLSSNYLSEISNSMHDAEWLEIQLNNLKEECLYSYEPATKEIIYRFTWLRSFDPPIAIRIENTNDVISLYWKMGKGYGGYDPEGIKSSGYKNISIEEWGKFERLIADADFENIQKVRHIMAEDGATWTLEKRKPNYYKACHSNIPNKKMKAACLYLLQLSNLRVKKDEIY